MTRYTLSTITALIGGLLVAGCQPPPSDAGVAETLKQINDRLEKLEKAPKQVAAAAPGAPDPAKEKAAGDLFTQANKLAGQGKADEAKALLGKISKEFAGTRADKQGKRLIQELNIVGKPAVAPKVTKWFAGSEADLGDVTKNTTLMVFWEVWCPHCKREMPELKETYDKFHGKGLNMVGLTRVTRSSSDEKVADFVKEHGIKYPVGKEDGKTAEHYGVSGIPAAAMVKDGKVVWRGHPARLTDAMIEGWL